jgi:hypothetical protein
MAAMLVPLTKEANEKSFANVHQHGGDDVTSKRSSRILLVRDVGCVNSCELKEMSVFAQILHKVVT